MTRLNANSVDASKEKHVPDVTREDGKIKVAVGSTLHPMIPEHISNGLPLLPATGWNSSTLSPVRSQG